MRDSKMHLYNRIILHDEFEISYSFSIICIIIQPKETQIGSEIGYVEFDW